MALALIDPFAQPYKDGSIQINTALEAANHIALNGTDNGLENHIYDALDASKVYEAWKKAMPSKRPTAIKTYQSDYDNRNDAAVDSEILTYGDTLDSGQILFHGGLWTGGMGSIQLSRPLSTTFSPNVAFVEVLREWKAYDAGRLDLIVLTTKTATTKAFVFNLRGNFSHEREVLLPAATTLTFVRETCLRQLNVSKPGFSDKKIPVYVVEVDVS
ncbi:hypothetical protein FLX27_26020 [Agrobacterium tumefaciens]|nr:hypothetical protein [Agrobacterium tumefaciens]TQN58727.1 hypothetical protein FLX27_26020 [Agrobacterium tumefaciens]